MMISKSFMPSVLMMAISTAMVGCGGGSGGESSSSNGGGTENPNNGSTNPKPVTCAETQYLEEGTCRNKAPQNIQAFSLSNLIQGQSYPLSLQTDQGLVVTFSSNTPNICSVSGGELKAHKVGQCNLVLTQAGTAKVLALNSSMTVNVSCAAEQYLENNVCVNKLKQTITPLKIKYILTESVYSLDTESSAKLPVTISSLSSSTCTYSLGELKGIGAGACTLNSPRRVIPKHWQQRA